jgi:saccharopine dehydrogenase-like NADP-dependent oxidoreductase
MERYGSNTGGPSAMAYTVGVPCGIAVQLVFDGKVGQPGINVPYNEKDCAIFREECEKEGITMVEKMF